MDEDQLLKSVCKLKMLQAKAERAGILQKAAIAEEAVAVSVDVITELVKREVVRAESQGVSHG